MEGDDNTESSAPRATRFTDRDAALLFPQATEVLSCTLGMAISAQATPHLNMLLRRVRMDSSRANVIPVCGLAFGRSRVVCGVHWASDVEAGRIVGAATVSRLHTIPVYLEQLALARKEVEAARAAGAKSPLDCEAQAKALAGGK